MGGNPFSLLEKRLRFRWYHVWGPLALIIGGSFGLGYACGSKSVPHPHVTWTK